MNLVSPPSLSQQPYDYVYYVWFMRFNALLNTLVTVLVIYLIIKRTPKEMEIYKWFLLNLSLIYIELLFFTGTSIFLALLFRLAAIYGRAQLFKKKSVTFSCIVLQLCFGLLLFFSNLRTNPTEDQSLVYMQTNYPSLLPFYQSHTCAVMFVDSEELIRYTCTKLLPTLVLICALICIVLVLIIRRLSMLKNSMFGKTYKMHKSLTISLCIQFAVPTCMVFYAEICSGLSVAMFQVNLAHAIFYASYIFATMHTFVSGIIMIALVKPYRKECAGIVSSLFQKIHRWETKASDLSLVVVTSSLNFRKVIVQPNGMLPKRRRSSFP